MGTESKIESYNWFAPTRVLFGQGQLANLHEQEMPGTKALLVISNGKSAVRNGSLEKTFNELKDAGVPAIVYNKISANPLKSAVEEGARIARTEKCDFVVALGGGSVMDAAKNIAMLTPQHTDDLWDFADGITGKKKPIEEDPLPWIAIPTSAGTGSEVDTGGVISNPATHEKLSVGGDSRMFARIAIVDPELMKSVPQKFTAYQGFDALFHSVEGYISKVHNPMGDMIQRAAIENAAGYLPRAVADGSDMEARTAMAFASTMSGYSMVVTSCIGEHGMEHAMSAYHRELPHGAGLIMISEEYFKFWIDQHVCDDRFIDMAKFMGVKDADSPYDFLKALADLQKECGVDDLKMSDYGIKKEDAMTLAENGMATMAKRFACDPRPMTAEECAGIFERSWK